MQSASTDLQHTFGTNTVIDVGYTLQRLYHEHTAAGCCDINYIPIGAGWPFNPAALDPPTAESTSNGIGAYQSASLQRTIFPGYAAIEMANFGRVATDRSQNLQISDTYDLPHFSRGLHLCGVSYVLDNWRLSGIMSVQSGIPPSPSCSLTSGAAAVTDGYTGTPDVGQRCEVIGNPFSNMPSNGNGQVYFSTRPPSLCPLLPRARTTRSSVLRRSAIGAVAQGSSQVRL